MKREFGFHDFRHTATSAIKRFTCLVTISSKANRYHRSAILIARFRFYRVASARALPNPTKIGIKSDARYARSRLGQSSDIERLHPALRLRVIPDAISADLPPPSLPGNRRERETRAKGK